MRVDSDSHTYELGAVDEEWYLSEYPDVAEAGFAAAEHYLKHGKNEGRYPRNLKSKTLEKSLWMGFHEQALKELSEFFESEHTDYNERLYSALSLARWHASNNNWALGARYAEFLTNEASPPAYLLREGSSVISANIHIRNSNFNAAQKSIRLINSAFVQKADQYLLIANLLTKSGTDVSGPLALGPIGDIYESVCLEKFEKSSTKRKASFENLLDLKPTLYVTRPQKISVIVPAYNASSYIGQALQCLQTQSWVNLEIIVVDDASTDDTHAVVSALATGDSRIRIIRRTTRGGAYSARNLGLKEATGEFIVNHDSDDWSHPRRLEIMIEPMLENPSIIASICSWVRVDSEFLFLRPRPDAQLVHSSVSTIMIRALELRSIGGWNEAKVAADSELWFRIRTLYGAECTAELLPGIPLVISREVEDSLTTAPVTHWRTDSFGLRNIYRQCYELWHSGLSKNNPAKSITHLKSPPFFIPVSNRVKTDDDLHYSAVIYANLSPKNPKNRELEKLVSSLIDSPVRFALFHWPAYLDNTADIIDDYYLALANEGAVDLVTPDQYINTDYLVFCQIPNINFHTKFLPHTKFDRLISLNSSTQAKALAKSVIEGAIAKFANEFRLSAVFDKEWYTSLYPDIRASGIPPLEHFLSHGLSEGRQPSPSMNIEYYRYTYLSSLKIQAPPIMHYFLRGRHTGYSIGNPNFEGLAKSASTKRTVLACGHCSDSTLFGAERSFLEVIQHLSKSGYNIIVTLPSYNNPAYLEKIRQHSVHVYILPCPLWEQSPQPSTWTISNLELIIEKHAVDLVYANTLMLREPLIAARNTGKRSITHAHEVFDRSDMICIQNSISPEFIYGEIKRLSSLVIANSAFTANCLDISEDQCRVIPNSVSTQDLKILTKAPHSDVLYVGIISSNLEKKGLSDFFKIAQFMESTNSKVFFIVRGPLTPDLSKHLLNCPKNLKHHEYTESTAEAISELDVILNLSICKETFGRTVIEGMAAGKAVIAYNHGALSEAIKDKETGYLIDLNDTHSVILILEELIADPNKLVRVGKKARAFAIKNYSDSKVKALIKSAFQYALAEK